MAGGIIGALRITLGLDTAAFDADTRKATTSVGRMQSSMSKAASAVAASFAGMLTLGGLQSLRDMTREALSTVGALGEQAQQLGVTTDALQEFRYIASQTGVEQGEIDKALQRLTRTLGEIQMGAKGPTEALKALGLSAEDLKGLTADQALAVLADAFNKLPDAATRSAIGFDLMGRSFQTLLPLLAEGSKGIQQMIKDAHEAGIVLTEEEIRAADRYDDAISAIDQKTKARQAAFLARNGETLVTFEEQWAEFKIRMMKRVVEISNLFDEFGKGDWLDRVKITLDVFESYLTGGVMTKVREFATSVGTWIREMVTVIGQQVIGRLGGYWDRVGASIDKVKGWFFDLYDAVVGHSYIPDMVDGIAAHMARLDKEMVDPARRAAQSTGEAMRAAAEETLALYDKLFPEIRRANEFIAEGERIRNDKDLTDAEKEEALRRSSNLFGSGNVHGPEVDRPSILDSVVGEDWSRLSDAFLRRMDELADGAEVGTTRIAKSFKDMADDTLGALSRLTSAIKGGGFLNILESVIGFGLQLGSVGAFGKTIQTRLNSTATGSVAGLSGRGAGGAGSATVVISPSQYFDAHVVQGAAAVVQQAQPALTRTTLATAAFKQSRSLARA